MHAPAAPASQNEAPPPMDDLDNSVFQVWALAKEMHKTWSAIVGKRNNYPWLTALGTKITSAHVATKAKVVNIKAMGKEGKVDRGVDVVNQGEEGDGQGDGQGQGQGEGQEGEGQGEGD